MVVFFVISQRGNVSYPEWWFFICGKTFSRAANDMHRIGNARDQVIVLSSVIVLFNAKIVLTNLLDPVYSTISTFFPTFAAANRKHYTWHEKKDRNTGACQKPVSGYGRCQRRR